MLSAVPITESRFGVAADENVGPPYWSAIWIVDCGGFGVWSASSNGSAFAFWALWSFFRAVAATVLIAFAGAANGRSNTTGRSGVKRTVCSECDDRVPWFDVVVLSGVSLFCIVVEVGFCAAT